MTTGAGLLALAFAIFVAWTLSRVKEPPSFAYMALTVFAIIPIALLLKAELSHFALQTPEGQWALKVESLEKQVETIQGATRNLANVEHTEAATIQSATPQQSTAAPQFSTPIAQSSPVPQFKSGAKVKIVEIDPKDGFYDSPISLVGSTGVLRQNAFPQENGFYAADIVLDRKIYSGDDGRRFFAFVKLELADK